VRPALRRCIAVDPAEFGSRYWDAEPLLSRAGDLPDKGFEDLLDVESVDDLLSQRGLRTPFLRVAKDGKLVPAAQYTGGGGLGAEVADQVRDDRIAALVADGATLVLQGLHRLWPPLIDFAVALRTDLGVPVQVNAYFTPPGNRGFATHYDTHSVFVLQVAGRKRWRIHPPVLPEPIERQPWGGRAEEVAATADQPPYLDTVLDPGDALYLPRGWLHAAEALDGEHSLHLTIGLRAPTRHTVLEALVDLAIEEPALRAGLPLDMGLRPEGIGRGGTDVTSERWIAGTMDALRGWLDTVDPARVAERLRGRAWQASRPAPVRPIAQASAAAGVSTVDTVSVRSGLSWRLDGETLRLPDRTITFPPYCLDAVRAALSGPIRVGDLPGLDDADRLVLVRRLLRESVVVPVSATPGSGARG
jgi:bifunctional lysine-specific demethylase and histidyl-hydroxylase NO66